MSTDTPLRPVAYDRHRTTEVWACLRPGRGMRKLTDAEAERVRHLYWVGRRTQRYLAAEFGVSHNTIYRIVNAISYKEIAA